MPAVNPRITITLQPSTHALLRKLSELTGNSQSAIVGELLQGSEPIFERMTSLLEAAAKLKAQGLQASEEVRLGLEQAHRRLEGQMGLAFEAFDEGGAPLLEQAERVSRRRGGMRAKPAPGPAARSAATPLSNRGVTPLKKAKTNTKKSALRGS